MNLAEPALFEADADILSYLLEAHDIDFKTLQEKGCFYPSEEPILWEDLAFRHRLARSNLPAHRRARRPFAYTITGTILAVTDTGRRVAHEFVLR